MPILTKKQIKYGFNYYHKDEQQAKFVVAVSEYNGESSLTINCTQLGDNFTPQYKTQKEKKRIVQEWCHFLTENPTAFEELSFGTRMPQKLFNAVCKQTRLKKLDIKWGVYPDISSLENLQTLELLHIGSGASVQSINAISSLKNLVALSVENFQKIHDYSILSNLQKLESLSIEGDAFGPQYIHVDSLDFLNNMLSLRFFRFGTARLKIKDMSPVLSLINLEHLTLCTSKETKAIYESLAALPNLKYGLIAENPELYKQ